MSLLRDEAPNAQNLRPGVMLWLIGLEVGSRYTATDDAQLVPLILIDERHQLTPSEIADAYHDVRVPHLLGETEVARVKELVWTVHCEAPRPVGRLFRPPPNLAASSATSLPTLAKWAWIWCSSCS